MSESAHPSHHLKIVPADMAGNDGLGRYVLLPGSPGRARQIAESFDVLEREIITPRHNDTYLGRIRGLDGAEIAVAASSTGMGPGSTEITAVELIQAGARRLIRVGTSGSVQFRTVRIGSLVVATGAVRDELASQHYVALEYPAVAHPDTVLAAERAAFALGQQDRTYKGIVHTKASLFARAIFLGPRQQANLAYKDELIAARVLSSEMEASVLFVVSSTLSAMSPSVGEERSGAADVIKAGTLLGIIGGEDAWATDEEIAEIEARSCAFALETIRQLARIDGQRGPV
ncbi:MAG: uridine phosphorylase [Myxococcota bacterium]|jgi:uridine phosphorylase|nr:uridine phosphorylase [Myxococcota bacterium]